MIRTLLLAFATSAFAAPIERVWLTHATNDPSKIVINWETERPAHSSVEFGTSENFSHFKSDSEQVTLHHIEIPLEQRDVVYHYRVRSGDDVSSIHTFKGCPSKDLRIAIVGDWGYAPGKDVSAIVKDDVHLLLTVGDNVASLHEKGREGTKAFSALIDANRELFRSTPFMPILGNHDEMMLQARNGKDDFKFWMNCGGITALDSYGSSGRLDLIPAEHFRFLQQCVHPVGT